MKKYHKYYGRSSPIGSAFGSTPSILEMLETLEEDMPDYKFIQAIEYSYWTMAGTVNVAYLLVERK